MANSMNKIFRSFETLHHFIAEGSKVTFQPSSQPYCKYYLTVTLKGIEFRENTDSHYSN